MDERVRGGWTAAEREEIGARWRRRESLRTIARHFGRDSIYVRRLLADLVAFTRADLDAIAAELDGRPRETPGWRSPAERFLGPTAGG